MDERQTSRSRAPRNNNQRSMVIFSVAVVISLIIGGIIGSAVQSGRAKKAVNELNERTVQYTQELEQKDTRIATLEQEIAAKQQELDSAGAGVPVTPENPEAGIGTDGDNAAPEPESEGKSGGWLGIFIIIFIIVVIVITAIYFIINALKRRDDDDDDDYDDDDEDYDDDDYDDDDEDEEEE